MSHASARLTHPRREHGYYPGKIVLHAMVWNGLEYPHCPKGHCLNPRVARGLPVLASVT